jgi:hypothetical protein
MVMRLVAILIAIGAGLSATQAAAPESLSFNCDAVPGEVTAMADHLPATATAISGNFRAIQIRQDNNLSPAATVKLASRKDFVALQMTPIEPNSLTFLVFVRNGDAHEEERTMVGQVMIDQPMPFRLTRDGKNVVVSAAGQTVTVRQSFRGAPNIGVSCSTGKFLFENVQVQ